MMKWMENLCWACGYTSVTVTRCQKSKRENNIKNINQTSNKFGNKVAGVCCFIFVIFQLKLVCVTYIKRYLLHVKQLWHLPANCQALV